MNDEQKQFITDRLCPFILRENGNGFAMETWKNTFAFDSMVFDGVMHLRPACNTVMCVGGTIEHLMGFEKNTPAWMSVMEEDVAKFVGLTHEQARTLFYGWEGVPHRACPVVWPQAYIDRFSAESTPLGKAMVVVDLLHEVAATDGAVLETGARWEEDGN